MRSCSRRARGCASRPGLEITLETNPGTAEHGRFEGYRAAGVNRLSFGIQSFDDACLQRLGRIHDSREADSAVKLAQDAGYDNINLDLMYALPEQTLEMAVYDVERALALQPAHLSHYQLTLEPNTVFAARPPQGIPGLDESWDIQEACQARIAEAGFEHYEVSAYAKPGRQSAHNLNYWRFGDYLGIGAGAHGKLTLGASQIGAAPVEGQASHRVPGQGRHARLDRRRRNPDHAAPALRLHAQRPATARGLRARCLRGAHRPAARSHRAPTGTGARTGLAHAWRPTGHVRPTELGRRFTNDVIELFLADD